MKRIVYGLLVLAALGLAGFLTLGPGIVERAQNRKIEHAPWPVSAAARALHESLRVADWHADSLLWNRDLLERGSYGHADIPRLAEGNVAVQVFTTVTKVPAGLNYQENAADARDNITLLSMAQLWPPRSWQSLTERALYQSQKLHELQARAPDRVRVIRSRGDLAAVLAAREAGRPLLGAIMGAEGAHALEGDIKNLGRLYDAGFRVIGLQHFFDNALGGSLHGQSGAGLTDFGREVVREMAARRIIIDLAHSSPRVVRDVLAMVDVPVIVSHTGIDGNCPSKRNFDDALMQEIAAAGGLVGIGFWEEVTCDPSPDGVAKTIKAAIDLLGVGAVSLGSDYDGAIEAAFDASELAALTDALLRAGLTEEEIRAVMGENLLGFLAANLPQ